MPHLLPILTDGAAGFEAALAGLAARGPGDLEAVAPAVREILAAVRAEGDAAVRRYVERFERRTPGPLLRGVDDGAAALSRLAPAVRDGLVLAAGRIERFHRRQWDAELAHASFLHEEDGVTLGMRVRPLARVGVYAPGGKARYPSSVLMTAVPARVAGVRDIVLATPAPDDRLLAAAHLAGVTTVLDAGGAHAIAALAYGTASVRRVDKILGPGNAYVACAKRLVFGEVAIDALAGPSEILVLADAGADPALVAADLLSQAEHDEAAYVVLVTTSPALAEAVAAALDAQLPQLDRRVIAEAAVRAHGVALVVPSTSRLGWRWPRPSRPSTSPSTSTSRSWSSSGWRRSARPCWAPPRRWPWATTWPAPPTILPTGGCGALRDLRSACTTSGDRAVEHPPVLRRRRSKRDAPAVSALARAEGLTAHARAVELRVGGAPPQPRGVKNPQSGA